jgi:hypothetical protein
MAAAASNLRLKQKPPESLRSSISFLKIEALKPSTLYNGGNLTKFAPASLPFPGADHELRSTRRHTLGESVDTWNI